MSNEGFSGNAFRKQGKSKKAANASSDAETLVNSEDESDLFMKRKTWTMNSESSTLKRNSEGKRGSFAALVLGNVSLIFLEGSLVKNLLKQPETFESKIVGCFVRIRIDYPRFHETYRMLGLVTGIRKSSEEYKIGNTSTDMLLCIFGMFEVKISMLVNGDIHQAECEDLRLMAQKEYFKRLIVGDVATTYVSSSSSGIESTVGDEIAELTIKFDVGMIDRNLACKVDERKISCAPVVQPVHDDMLNLHSLGTVNVNADKSHLSTGDGEECSYNTGQIMDSVQELGHSLSMGDETSNEGGSYDTEKGTLSERAMSTR